MRRLSRAALVLAVIVGIILVLARLLSQSADPRNRQWATGDEEERHALVTVQREACPGAPFILPSDGFIGLLYGDPNRPYSPSWAWIWKAIAISWGTGSATGRKGPTSG